MVGGMTGVEKDVIPFGTVMGDRARSKNAFRLAEQALGYNLDGDYYQTPLRDLAGVLAQRSPRMVVRSCLSMLRRKVSKARHPGHKP